MKITINVQDEKVRRDVKAFRSGINGAVRTGLKRAVERLALPVGRRLVPRHDASSLEAGSTTRSAFLQLNKKHGDELLLEFGGTRRDVLRPKNAQALMTPFGPRAAVKRPRHYRGRHALEKTIEQTKDRVTRAAEQTVAEELSKHLEVGR